MIEKTAKRVLKIEAQAIEGLIPRIDRVFVQAVSLMQSCQGRVVVTGMGKSGIIGKKVAATLASTGTPSFYLHPAEGGHGDLGMVCRGDLLLAISNSGETDELNRMIPVLKRLAVPIIALTGNTKSTLAQNSEIVLDVSVKQEAGPEGVIPTASTTAALALGDALAISLLDARGLKPEDFAFFHPGGSIGRKLLIRVSDLMHAGEAIPIVQPNTSMKEVIMVMTTKKLGMTTVEDVQGQLCGVITDGDLRRLLRKESDPLSRIASEVMSPNPKTIAPDILATQAVQMMEEFSITALVVVEKERRIRGIIHLHDLLKSGIV